MSKQNQQAVVDWRALSRLEQKITADEHGGIMHRWLYGREVLKARAGRKQLPDGMIDDLVKAGDRGGKTISATEIRYRIRFAEAYALDQQVIRLSADLGTWSEIIAKGFPEVTIDTDLTEPQDLEPPSPDDFEQLSLLPGFKQTVRVHGRDMPIDEATVPDLIAYRDKYRAMHEGFGKTLAVIEATVETVLDGWDRDPLTKAIDAYKRALATT